ncbi:hypothetical protein Pelo_14763 [Pelomyxa schiedti]|nr:hypothetical protein Pelo_14763 [Pelomyxa schiedti]
MNWWHGSDTGDVFTLTPHIALSAESQFVALACAVTPQQVRRQSIRTVTITTTVATSRAQCISRSIDVYTPANGCNDVNVKRDSGRRVSAVSMIGQSLMSELGREWVVCEAVWELFDVECGDVGQRNRSDEWRQIERSYYERRQCLGGMGYGQVLGSTGEGQFLTYRAGSAGLRTTHFIRDGPSWYSEKGITIADRNQVAWQCNSRWVVVVYYGRMEVWMVCNGEPQPESRTTIVTELLDGQCKAAFSPTNSNVIMLFCCEGVEDDRILHIDLEKTWETQSLVTARVATIQRGAKGILFSDPPWTLHLNAATHCYSLVNRSTNEVHTFPSGLKVEVITTQHVCVYQNAEVQVRSNVKVYHASNLATPCFALDPWTQLGAINLICRPLSNVLFVPQIMLPSSEGTTTPQQQVAVVNANTGAIVATLDLVPRPKGLDKV